MALKLYDWVKMPLPKARVQDETEYSYGKIVAVSTTNSEVEVLLKKDHNGRTMFTVPEYMLTEVSWSEYINEKVWKPSLNNDAYLGRDAVTPRGVSSTDCLHNFQVVGRSPVLDREWINCTKCGIPQEDV